MSGSDDVIGSGTSAGGALAICIHGLCRVLAAKAGAVDRGV
jgi:hypothetical protein